MVTKIKGMPKHISSLLACLINVSNDTDLFINKHDMVAWGSVRTKKSLVQQKFGLKKFQKVWSGQ